MDTADMHQQSAVDYVVMSQTPKIQKSLPNRRTKNDISFRVGDDNL